MPRSMGSAWTFFSMRSTAGWPIRPSGVAPGPGRRRSGDLLRGTGVHVDVAGEAVIAIDPIAVTKLTRHSSVSIVLGTQGNVTNPYDFQGRFPDTKPALSTSWTCATAARGSTAPKCGTFSKFYRMASEPMYAGTARRSSTQRRRPSYTARIRCCAGGTLRRACSRLRGTASQRRGWSCNRTGRLKTAEGMIAYAASQFAGRELLSRSGIRDHLKGRTEVLDDLAAELPRSCLPARPQHDVPIDPLSHEATR